MNRKIELNHLLNQNYIEEGGYIMKTLMSVLVLIFLTTNVNANANTVVSDKVNAITNWIANEKAKTIEFQKNNWNKAKNTFPWNMLFKKESE